MSAAGLTEDVVEQAALEWLSEVGFTIAHGPHIAPGEPESERETFGDVVLSGRPDVVLFINGLPLVVIELKNQADEGATVEKAYRQIQTYKHEIGSLFHFNEIVVVSDGHLARIRSLTAGYEWLKPWRTIESETPVTGKTELEIVIRGAFAPERMLALISGFVLFEDDPDSDDVKKILAGYHQFNAARQAIAATIDATSAEGDRRCGVVWHTQGSGKSFTMLFYSGQVISRPEMNNPTIVVLTDRNDLDDQLFGQFQRCSEILRQKPIQAESVEHLRDLLQVSSGGVIFTTVHKFAEADGQFPMLTDRKNVVVMADEAHRSQYGFTAKQTVDEKTGEAKVSYGFARNIRDGLPNASFIGFTGTPIELKDANTRAVFGDYVSVYDIQRAVEDKATVPIYYESRIIKMALADRPMETLDEDFDESVRIAEAEYNEHQPDVIVGSSRGGAVAVNMDSKDTPLVLLCPAWKNWGTATTIKPNTIILHSRQDEVIPFADSQELLANSGLPPEALIEVGNDHRLADVEPLEAMLDACERLGGFND